jgi:hypothetical protein
MTTYEAAVRLLAAETPEEKERAERAYLATWTAAQIGHQMSDLTNVVSLAEWKASRGSAGA